MKLSAAIDKASDEIKDIPLFRETLDWTSWSVSGFFSHARYSIKLIFLEKEIIFFSLLQVIMLALIYYLLAEMMVWLPEDWWKLKGKGSGLPLLIMILWSMFCAFLVSLPLGLLDGCIGAAHFLHRSGQKSTIATCLRLVSPSSWSLWLHSWFVFLQMIPDKPTKKGFVQTSAEKETQQRSRDALKFAVMGFLPGIVIGKSAATVTDEIVDFVASKLQDLARLRSGYRIVFQTVMAAIYAVLLVLFLVYIGSIMKYTANQGEPYRVFIVISAPIFIALAVVYSLLRPIYLISLFDIYSDYHNQSGKQIFVRPASVGLSVLIGFLLLDLGLLVVYLFRQELGILKMLGSSG